jgi:hypothetical protein
MKKKYGYAQIASKRYQKGKSTMQNGIISCSKCISQVNATSFLNKILKDIKKFWRFEKTGFIFAALYEAFEILAYGVMVTQLILVQSFKVRVLVGQLLSKNKRLLYYLCRRRLCFWFLQILFYRFFLLRIRGWFHSSFSANSTIFRVRLTIEMNTKKPIVTTK